MPAITIRSLNVGLMLGQRHRRWTSIKPTLGECYFFVFLLWMSNHFIFSYTIFILMLPVLPVCFHCISLKLSCLLGCEDVLGYLPQPILCQPCSSVSHAGATSKLAFTSHAVLSWMAGGDLGDT